MDNISVLGFLVTHVKNVEYMGEGVNSKVEWREIKDLANRADTLYASKLPQDRPNDPVCTNHTTNTSFEIGLPILENDITTPFPINFPVEGTVLQRFEFAYYNLDPDTEVSMYPPYYNRQKRPVLHSMFIANGDTGGVVGQPRKELATHPDDLLPNAAPDNTKNLIESPLHKLWKWWPACENYSQTRQIAAELYFVTNPESKCPCPAVYRVAFAVSADGQSRNMNGNSELGGRRAFPPYNANIHYWPRTQVDGQSYFRAMTLHEVPWKNYGPEYYRPDEGNIPVYDPPVTGCCATPIFPRIGWEGGVVDPNTLIELDGLTMYDSNIFYRTYWGAITKPYTPVGENLTMSLQDYFEEYAKGKMPLACPADRLDLYELSSKYENWLICKEGRSVQVRVTALRFEVWPRPNAPTTDVVCQIVWVPTAIIVPLQGKFQPAIRKRWYNMIYNKLRVVAGGLPPGARLANTGDDESGWDYTFPRGTSWNENGHSLLTGFDAPLARWLRSDYGWEPNAKVRFMVRAWWGEKYWEQFLCNRNSTQAKEVSCAGNGTWNTMPGCFCAEDMKPVPFIEDTTCYDLACEYDIVMPWDGGCSNEECITPPEAGSIASNRTHWATVYYLRTIHSFINTYKIPEPLDPYSIYVVERWKVWNMPKSNLPEIPEPISLEIGDTDEYLDKLKTKAQDRNTNRTEYFEKCDNLDEATDIKDERTVMKIGESHNGHECIIALRDCTQNARFDQFAFEAVASMAGLCADKSDKHATLTVKFDPNWMFRAPAEFLIYDICNNHYAWANENELTNYGLYQIVYEASEIPNSQLSISVYYGPDGTEMVTPYDVIDYTFPDIGNWDFTNGEKPTWPEFTQTIELPFAVRDYQYHFNVVLHIKFDAFPGIDGLMLERILNASINTRRLSNNDREYIFGTSFAMGGTENSEGRVWRWVGADNTALEHPAIFVSVSK